jgi:hypothetical protein
MSFEASALVLAWVAIVLLALGLAGLLRQVQLLSRGRVAVAPAPGTAAAHSPRDLVGFRLPRQGPLADLVHPAAHRTVLAFVSPGCPSCTQTLERLAAAPDVTTGSVALVAVSTGSCAPAEAALGSAGRCVPQGRPLLDQLRVPATPYLVAVGVDGTLVAAVLPDEDTDVAGWVRHSRGSLSVTEERPRE